MLEYGPGVIPDTCGRLLRLETLFLVKFLIFRWLFSSFVFHLFRSFATISTSLLDARTGTNKLDPTFSETIWQKKKGPYPYPPVLTCFKTVCGAIYMAGYVVLYMAPSTMMQVASGRLHPSGPFHCRGFHTGWWCHIWYHISCHSPTTNCSKNRSEHRGG